MTGFLPLLGEERPERADAAANREKVLAAAEKLFASCDPSTVSMDAVAAEAGVGKGTLFRRFGDRAGLARAVLSRHEIDFQDAIIRGAPPLGPGAPAARAADRLRRAPTSSSSRATARCCARPRARTTPSCTARSTPSTACT